MSHELESALADMLEELRERLLRDAAARAAGEPIRGGARRHWAEMVRTLAELMPSPARTHPMQFGRPTGRAGAKIRADVQTRPPAR